MRSAPAPVFFYWVTFQRPALPKKEVAAVSGSDDATTATNSETESECSDNSDTDNADCDSGSSLLYVYRSSERLDAFVQSLSALFPDAVVTAATRTTPQSPQAGKCTERPALKCI